MRRRSSSSSPCATPALRARRSIIGAAPLLSVGIALIFLDEEFDPLLLFATLLVVAGGAVLAFDRSRPANFRMLGVWLAFLCAVLFSVRDNLVRWATQDVDPPPIAAAAASLLGAFVTVTVYVLVVRRGHLGTISVVVRASSCPRGSSSAPPTRSSCSGSTTAGSASWRR